MIDVAPFAYPASGNVIVLGDGPELLVYSGANDQGVWKIMGDDIIMGVGVTGDQVISIDGSGTLISYRAIDGGENYRFETECAPMGMAVSPEGSVVVITASALVLIAAGVAPVTVPWPSPRRVAWGPGSASLGVGGADGTFAAFDPVSQAAWGTVNLGSAITGVAWIPSGVWAVAHGQQISFVNGEGSEVIESIPVGAAIGSITLSGDGAVMAVVRGGDRVAVFEMQHKVCVGEITYQRPVSDIAFGPKHWLAIGFDMGDANRLDVIGGTMTRTQAHPGRGQNAWAMQAQVTHSKVRGAVAAIATGGAAIAVANKVVPVKKKRSWMPVLALVGITIFGLLFILCGGGALLTYFDWFRP